LQQQYHQIRQQSQKLGGTDGENTINVTLVKQVFVIVLKDFGDFSFKCYQHEWVNAGKIMMVIGGRLEDDFPHGVVPRR